MSTLTETETLFTVGEAAYLTGISKGAIYQRIHRGRLRVHSAPDRERPPYWSSTRYILISLRELLDC